MGQSIQSLSGEVTAALVSRLVAWIAGSGITGCLEVEHGDAVSRAYFRDGKPCGAVVLQGFKPLGLLLLEHGVIDIDALGESLSQVASTGRPQGEILVGMGRLTVNELSYWLQVQQRDRLHKLLALTSGAFRFDPDAELPTWTNEMALSPHIEVFHFLRSDWGGVHRHALLDMLETGPLQLAPFDPAPVFGLSEYETDLWRQLDGAASGRQVLVASETSSRDAATIATLACFHYVLAAETGPAPLGHLSTEAISSALETLASGASDSSTETALTEPIPEFSTWRAPLLDADGIVQFETEGDLDAVAKLFIEQGSIIVATDVHLPATEEFAVQVAGPDGEVRTTITCSLSSVPEQGLALLRIVGASPAEVISALRSLPEAGQQWSDRPRPSSNSVPPIPAEGRLSLPASPADLIDGDSPTPHLSAVSTKGALSPLHLLAWLRASSKRDVEVRVVPPTGGEQSFDVTAGIEVQCSVEISSLASRLAQEGTRYSVKTNARPSHRRVTHSLQKLILSTTKAILRTFSDEALGESFGARMSLCPRLSEQGRKIVRTLGLSAPQSRVVQHSLDGTRKVWDILASGIGQRAAWEMLYLLEMRGGLEWISPQALVQEDPVEARWIAIQGKDHFEILGLHWSSHPRAIEEAFKSLEEMYGPTGRLRGSSPPVADKLWERMKESYSVIAEPEGRKKHRKERYPSMSFSYQAELLVGQARLAHVRGEAGQARLLLESALDIAPIKSAKDLLRRLHH